MKTSNEENTENTIRLKKVDLDLFMRFLIELASTSSGITHLQMKTGTNHNACVKYVTLLERLKLAEFFTHEDNKHIRITNRGRESLRIISLYLQ